MSYIKSSLFTAVAVACVVAGAFSARAQSTVVTYQGRLAQNGAAANGTFDLKFSLFDAVTNGNQIGGTVEMATVAVTNGLFTVGIDFGPVFSGTNYWLDIAVA